MHQSQYVVQFNGLSIPLEDVHTHSSTVGYKQNFYNGKVDNLASDKDVFKKFLNKEQSVLKHGFGDWCATAFLNESKCSIPQSSTRSEISKHSCVGVESVNTGAHDISLNPKSNVDQLSIEQFCELLPSPAASSKNEEQYWFKIDPSSFVLTDQDYLRAKCRWQFKHVTDFETNCKAIERMRYLELFTQCFTLRVLNDTACNFNDEGTYYNFLSNDIGTNEKNMQTDYYNLNLENAYDVLPEKEGNYVTVRNTAVNYTFEENNRPPSCLYYAPTDNCNYVNSNNTRQYSPTKVGSKSFDRPCFQNIENRRLNRIINSSQSNEKQVNSSNIIHYSLKNDTIPDLKKTTSERRCNKENQLTSKDVLEQDPVKTVKLEEKQNDARHEVLTPRNDGKKYIACDRTIELEKIHSSIPIVQKDKQYSMCNCCKAKGKFGISFKKSVLSGCGLPSKS